jgi:hypothetical protein
MSPGGGDRYTFKIEGRGIVAYPRPSSLIRIIDKSNALIWWATDLEQRAFKLALEDVLTAPGIANDPQYVYDEMMRRMDGKRAHVKARDEAANIGTMAHDWIRWQTHKMLGNDPGDEPVIPEPSMRAAVGWLEWARSVDYTPIDAELFLYCEYCAVAGTTDTIAKVNGIITVVDYKTAPPPKKVRKARVGPAGEVGKCRVYPEALIQVAFYKHLARVRGIDVQQTMVVRLPKFEGDSWCEQDAVIGPDLPLRLLQGIATTWRTMQWMEGRDFGTSPEPHPEGAL